MAVEQQEFLTGTEAVRFFGRTDAGVQPGRVYFNWSGSGFSFSFTGTAAYARLHTASEGERRFPSPERQAWIGVYADGGEEAVARFSLDRPDGWYTLVQGLPAGRHTLRVVKHTECGYGRAALSALKTVGTRGPQPTRPYARRLEFIGDSITCGYGNICTTASPAFITKEEDASRTYASFLGRLLGAEISCVCASGNGIFHDYGCGTHNLMPELYRYTDTMLAGHLGAEPTPWDFSRFVPHLIGIKLGANDSRYCDGWDLPDEAARTAALKKERRQAFSQRLLAFLDEVADKNPGVPLLYITDTDTILLDTILETLQTWKTARPRESLTSVTLDSKRPWEGEGANGHWSAATHRRAALVLEPIIRDICGWPREAVPE